MANKKRNRSEFEWARLAKQAAAEMDKPDPRDFDKAEQLLVRALDALRAERNYPRSERFRDEALLLSTLAFAYVGQRRLALGCQTMEFVVQRVCGSWPAHIDDGLQIWQSILSKAEHLYLSCGHQDKALDVAVERLDKINEMADMLMEDSEDFPGVKVWVGDVLPRSQNAVLKIRMEQVQTQEQLDQVISLLQAS
jgi:hypothetical protein